MGFFDRVYAAVKRVPKGKVTTYGQIAALLGATRCSRQVGYALHVNPQPGIVPCHRVVNRFGGMASGFAFGGPEAQAAALEAEGVSVGADFTVDLSVYLWDPDKDSPTSEA